MRWSARRGSGRTTARRPKWRLLVWPLVAATAEVTLYYVLPLSRTANFTTVLWLVLGLSAFTLILVVQVKRITTSAYPRLRALDAILTSVPVFLLIFSAAYYVAEKSTPSSFNQPLSRTDALYFALTVFATVGFGDIVPTSETMRVVVMFQMLGDLVVIGLLGRVVVGAINVGLQRRDGPDREGASASSSEAGDDH